MFQLVTDSCCDLPYNILEENNISYLTMTIQLNGKEYQDDLGKTFDYTFFLKSIKQGGQPTTSQINVGRYLEFFRPYVEKDCPVLYLCFSSAMSGSYQSACQAAQMLEEEFERHPKIMIIDTKNASLGQGLLVLEAAKLQKQKKTIEEVYTIIENKKEHVHSWVTVDDLNHLQRGGRISKTAATIGSLMNIKPIITVDSEGRLQSVGKARGRNKALQTLVDETIATIVAPADQTVLIAYAGDLESAQKVQQMIQSKIQIKEVLLYPLGPTITSHTGYGCTAVFSFGTKRK